MSAKKRLAEPQDAITFRCETCYAHEFSAAPSRTEPDETAPHHPWRYFGLCPRCGAECEQAKWERGLFKAWVSSTGPRTEEGKAATAKNLEGHPTPEEALRTRFNAMKHGMSARVATYFPARPDKYSFCANCEVDRTWCGRQSACTKQTEIFMLHHAAMEQKKPGLLVGLHADFQASVFLIVQMILQQIVADGVQQKKPVYRTLEDGTIEVADYFDLQGNRHIIYDEIQAHPLFKPLGEILSKNNMSLADMGVTQKTIEREEDAMGYIAKAENKTELLTDFAVKQAAALTNLAEMMAAAREQRKRDPVLIEHDAQEGGRA